MEGTPRELPRAVEEQITDLSKVVSHPQFIALLTEIEEAPEEERVDVASRLASVAELEARGIPIPQNMRLTTRWFENVELDRGRGERLLAEATADRRRTIPPGGEEIPIHVCGSLGQWVCGTVGTTFEL